MNQNLKKGAALCVTAALVVQLGTVPVMAKSYTPATSAAITALMESASAAAVAASSEETNPSSTLSSRLISGAPYEWLAPVEGLIPDTETPEVPSAEPSTTPSATPSAEASPTPGAEPSPTVSQTPQPSPTPVETTPTQTPVAETPAVTTPVQTPVTSAPLPSADNFTSNVTDGTSSTQTETTTPTQTEPEPQTTPEATVTETVHPEMPDPLVDVDLSSLDLNDTGGMVISQLGVDMIKSYEGFLPYATWDYLQYSVGYGSKCGSDEYVDTPITEQEAELRLMAYLLSFEKSVNSFLTKNNITVNQNQFDALVSFTYNVGTGWMYSDNALRTILVKGLNNYSDAEIQNAFGVWCHAGGAVLQGLVNRRASEASLFLSSLVHFSDVTEGDWYYDSVASAYYLGIFKDSGSTEFHPTAALTRAYFVTALSYLDNADLTDYASAAQIAATQKAADEAEAAALAENAAQAATDAAPQELTSSTTAQDTAAPATAQDTAAPATAQDTAAPATAQDTAAPATVQDTAASGAVPAAALAADIAVAGITKTAAAKPAESNIATTPAASTTGTAQTDLGATTAATAAIPTPVVQTPEEEPIPILDDVDGTSDWYGTAAMWAVDSGIALTSRNNFYPSLSFNKEELCLMISRYLDTLGIDSEADTVVDTTAAAGMTVASSSDATEAAAATTPAATSTAKTAAATTQPAATPAAAATPATTTTPATVAVVTPATEDETPSVDMFTDRYKISSYARDAVDLCVSLGLVSGDESGAFNPKATVTRAQAAQVLTKLYNIARNQKAIAAANKAETTTAASTSTANTATVGNTPTTSNATYTAPATTPAAADSRSASGASSSYSTATVKPATTRMR